MNMPKFVNESKAAKREEELFRPHPGEVFSRRILSKTDMKQPEIASILGVSVKHLSRFANGHVDITINLARKLEACTNISANAWLHYQAQYDLYTTAKLEKSDKLLSA